MKNKFTFLLFIFALAACQMSAVGNQNAPTKPDEDIPISEKLFITSVIKIGDKPAVVAILDKHLRKTVSLKKGEPKNGMEILDIIQDEDSTYAIVQLDNKQKVKVGLYKNPEVQLVEENLPDELEQERVHPLATKEEIQESYRNIRIPRVDFQEMKISRAITVIHELAGVYANDPLQGHKLERMKLNFDEIDSENEPTINISLKNMQVDRCLQFTLQQVNYTYEIGDNTLKVMKKK